MFGFRQGHAMPRPAKFDGRTCWRFGSHTRFNLFFAAVARGFSQCQHCKHHDTHAQDTQKPENMKQQLPFSKNVCPLQELHFKSRQELQNLPTRYYRRKLLCDNFSAPIVFLGFFFGNAVCEVFPVHVTALRGHALGVPLSNCAFRISSQTCWNAFRVLF